MNACLRPIRISVVLAMSVVFLPGCRESPLPEEGQALHREAGSRICAKMIRCLRPYTRTLREESRRMITVEACMATVEQQIAGTKLQDPAELALARACYEKELALDCRTFLVAPVSDPSCLQLTTRRLGIATLPGQGTK